MTKVETIKAVAERTGITQKDVDIVITGFGEVVLEAIAKNDSVKFANVCTFKGVDKPARTARNPRTGETINIPAKSGQPKAVFTKIAKE